MFCASPEKNPVSMAVDSTEFVFCDLKGAVSKAESLFDAVCLQSNPLHFFSWLLCLVFSRLD